MTAKTGGWQQKINEKYAQRFFVHYFGPFNQHL